MHDWLGRADSYTLLYASLYVMNECLAEIEGWRKTHRMPYLYRSFSSKRALQIAALLMSVWLKSRGGERPIGCLIFTGHFLAKEPYK